MSTPLFFPRRTVHLDFHTGRDVPDVAADFDTESFARTIAEGHIDSLTVFAKCHHGQLYYDTKRAERHPGLPPGGRHPAAAALVRRDRLSHRDCAGRPRQIVLER